MTKKPTPGPWDYEEHGTEIYGQGRVLAHLADDEGKALGRTAATQAAMLPNARIFAAGPELLAALKAAITDLESAYEGADDAAWTATLKAARAAVAKAAA